MRLFIVNSAGWVIEAPPNPINTHESAIAGNEELTVEVSGEVAAALTHAQYSMLNVIRVALAPFGLHPYDIAMPKYRRVVYRHEITGGP